MKGDDRCPEGANYADWLMNVLLPSEATPDNYDDMIEIRRAQRAHISISGKKPKKFIEEKIDLAKLGFATQPTVKPIKRRRI